MACSSCARIQDQNYIIILDGTGAVARLLSQV
jgi:hypothetical protein